MSFEDEDLGPTPLELRHARDATARTLEKAGALYAAFSCPATAECCQLAVTKREPWLWPTEWSLIEEHLEAEGRALPPPRPDGACPFLDAAGKRCTVYEARPSGCRTFFCHRRTGPGHESAEKLGDTLSELAGINIALWPEAQPRTILEWHAEACRRR